MDVLLKRIEIKECQNFTTSVIRPERRHNFFLDRTSITAQDKN